MGHAGGARQAREHRDVGAVRARIRDCRPRVSADQPVPPRGALDGRERCARLR